MSNTATAATRFTYDGANLIATSNTSGTFQRRFVLAPGSDEIIAEYKLSNNTIGWKILDERGSVVNSTDSSGVATAPNTYDEYGIPGTNAMRYQYTGQIWLGEVGLYYYKARMYSPTLGRFLQTDPIGYGDGLNWYNYVGSDPVNWSDPSGLAEMMPGTPAGGCNSVGADLYIGCDIVIDSGSGGAIGWVTPICGNGYGTCDGLGYGNGLYGGDGAGTGGAPGAPTPDDNHGCPAGTTYRGRGVSGDLICHTIPVFVAPKHEPKSETYKMICSWLADGAAAVGGSIAGVAVTALAVETGPGAPVIGTVTGFAVAGGINRSFNNSFCK